VSLDSFPRVFRRCNRAVCVSCRLASNQVIRQSLAGSLLAKPWFRIKMKNNQVIAHQECAALAKRSMSLSLSLPTGSAITLDEIKIVNKHLPLWIRHVIYNLRGGFLIRPLAIALTLGSVGAILSWLEETLPVFSCWMPAVLFPSHEDPQVAQVILGGIAGSIMMVVSIVFAILLMTLTLASMQFSPRIIVSFSRDRVTQWTLGIFLGTFCYCMAALPSARTLPKPFAPVATVLGAMLLAVVCVGWLLFFIHHISHAISVSHIVDRIASETEAMIGEMMPWPRRYTGQTAPVPPPHYEWNTTVLSDASGYIRFIDIGRLVSLAKTYHVKILCGPRCRTLRSRRNAVAARQQRRAPKRRCNS
jgi:hypothetical protein